MKVLCFHVDCLGIQSSYKYSARAAINSAAMLTAISTGVTEPHLI
jgi:hypothetical protein